MSCDDLEELLNCPDLVKRCLPKTVISCLITLLTLLILGFFFSPLPLFPWCFSTGIKFFPPWGSFTSSMEMNREKLCTSKADVSSDSAYHCSACHDDEEWSSMSRGRAKSRSLSASPALGSTKEFRYGFCFFLLSRKMQEVQISSS